MRKELEELLNNAYAPYSNFKVAAILKMKDGSLFKGVNVENASYGATICAERNAITTAIASGYKRNDFDTLYLMASSKKQVFPCFICRQMIVEFFNMEDNLIIYTENEEKEYKIKDIITNPFSSEDLK